MNLPVTLADLVQTSTQPQVLQDEINIALALGFPTTAWQPVQVDRSTLAIMAQLGSNYTIVVSNMAQGGYASLAATMVDANGNPIIDWMDLRGVDQYNVLRLQATYAAIDSSGFSITNASAASYGPFQPGQLHFQNPTTLATYTNSAVVNVAPSATTPVAIIADVAGSNSSSGPGTVTTFITGLIKCTVTNSKSLVGQNQELNGPYLQRCQSKLGTLSAKGPGAVYYFVATSMLDTTQPWYNINLTSSITRVTTLIGPSLVQVYIANASGAPSGGDVAIVNAAIQAWAVPSGTTATVTAATNVTIPVTYQLYIPAAAGISTPTIVNAVSAALVNYFASIPISGLKDQSSGVVPWSAILAVIATAVKGITSVTLTAPAADVVLTPTQVALLGTVTPAINFT